jgi:hypothetical protein
MLAKDSEQHRANGMYPIQNGRHVSLETTPQKTPDDFIEPTIMFDSLLNKKFETVVLGTEQRMCQRGKCRDLSLTHVKKAD